ncbi:MAG TPA: hypothetical protein VLL52_04165 [Anaerolineae bacterium]|nr:hypothetical protein [Anaerolineae bacterium]
MAKRNRAGKKRNQEDEFEQKLNVLDRSFDSVENDADLDDLDREVNDIESKLRQLPQELAKLRKRGYAHAGHLEGQLKNLDQQWGRVKRDVRRLIQDGRDDLADGLDEADEALERADRGRRTRNLEDAEEVLNDLKREVSRIKSDIRGRYSDIRSELSNVGSRLAHLDWILDNLVESGIKLYDLEGPIAAVEAEWQRDGKEGPDGILYLTDQRLIFEQKEKVAKKKFLGIFTTESETLQGILIEEQVRHIEEVAHSEEGGFLGFGKDDILELVFTPEATLTRARFHIDGQESADWAQWIKQVQDGVFDQRRAEQHALPEEELVAKKFPANCPNCMASVPPQPRGVNSVVCEFCNGTINAE